LQNGRPIAYKSRKVSRAETRYTTGEQELFAVVHALQTWRCYLGGVKITLITDHKPNTFFQTQPILFRHQARWSKQLQRFNFDWEYRAGRTNVADPLSRCPVGPALASMIWSCRGESPAEIGRSLFGNSPTMLDEEDAQHTVDLSPEFLETLVFACNFDPCLRDASNRESNGLRKTWQGVWLRETQIYVTDNKALKKQLFEELHDSKVAGHYGIHKTRRFIERLFWWPALRGEVDRYVRNCPVCHFNKASNQKQAGPLQPLPIPKSPFDSVSFDFMHCPRLSAVFIQ
jgi:hypothetical protein